MTKRQTAIVLAKVAGYHADTKAFIRLLVESRVNRQTMNEAWAQGALAKSVGVKCECHECRKAQGE